MPNDTAPEATEEESTPSKSRAPTREMTKPKVEGVFQLYGFKGLRDLIEKQGADTLRPALRSILGDLEDIGSEDHAEFAALYAETYPRKSNGFGVARDVIKVSSRSYVNLLVKDLNLPEGATVRKEFIELGPNGKPGIWVETESATPVLDTDETEEVPAEG